MVQAFLWHHYYFHNNNNNNNNNNKTRLEEEGGPAPPPESSSTTLDPLVVVSSAANRKKKRKKKKKPKKQQQQQPEQQRNGPGVEDEDDPDEEGGGEEEEAEAETSPPPHQQQHAKQSNAPEHGGDTPGSESTPAGVPPPKPNDTPMVSSPVDVSSETNPNNNNNNNNNNSKSTGSRTEDRDWWMQCYLDRVAAAASCEPSPKPPSPICPNGAGMKEFLQVLSTKVVRPPPASASQQPVTTNPTPRGGPRKGTTAANPSELEFHVSHKDVEGLASRIECYSCRSRVQQILSNTSKIPLVSMTAMRQGDSTQLVNPHHDYNEEEEEEDEEHPFDYVAMEEGTAVPLNDDEKTDSKRHQEDEALLVLQAVKTVSGETVGWRLCKNTTTTAETVPTKGEIVPLQTVDESLLLTEDDFSFLLREFFLLPAVSYDQWVGACDATTLSAEKIKTIQEEVNIRYTNTLQELTECMQALQLQQDKLVDCETQMNYGAADPENNGGFLSSSSDLGTGPDTIDMKSPMTLNEIDSGVCGLLGKLLRIVLQVTHAYQDVMLQWNGTSASGTPRPSSLSRFQRFPSFLLGQPQAMFALWHVYLDAFARIVQATTVYETKLLELADRQGVLKPFFLCKKSRHLLTDHVQAKIKIVLDAIESVRKKLDVQKDAYHTPAKVYRPTFLRSILTQQVLLKEVRTNVTHGPQFSVAVSERLKELGDRCEDVLDEIRSSWIENVTRNAIAQFEEVYQGKWGKLTRILGTARDKLKLDGLTRVQLEEENANDLKRLDNVLEQISTRGDDSQLGHGLRMEIVPAVEAMVRQWILQSTASYGSISVKGPATSSVSPKPLIMPLRLIQWMSLEEQSDRLSSRKRCHGTDGSFRATCILMACFFEWLVEHFNEWQAELAEHELLETMGSSADLDAASTNIDNGHATTLSSTVAVKKKAKKKRGKASQKAKPEEPTKVYSERNDSEEPTETEKHGPGVLAKEVDSETQSTVDSAHDAAMVSSRVDEPVNPLVVETCDPQTMEPKEEEGVTSKEVFSACAPSDDADKGRKDTDGPTNGHKKSTSDHEFVTDSGTNGVKTDEASQSFDKNGSASLNEHSTEPTEPEKEDEGTTIGVLDGSTFIPANEFLLQRLLDVLEGPDDGYPVVHL